MSKIEEILGRDINSIKELREEIKRLQDSIAGVDPETEQFKTTVEQLTAAQEQLRSVTGKNVQENNAAKDSIVGMEKEYRSLYNTYKMLSEEQRNSNMGKEIQQNLEILSDRLNKTKMGVGNFKDNIGRYTSSVIDAFKQMGVSIGGLAGPLAGATKGFSSLNTVMKANPVGLIIAAVMTLINVIKSLSGAVKNNEELQHRWNKAMAAFQPIIDGIKRALDSVAGVIVRIVEAAAAGIRKIQELWARAQDFFSDDKEHFKRLKEEEAAYDGIADAQKELTTKRREYNKLNSKDKAEIERLREEASLLQKGAEQREMINKAIELQKQVNARNNELAQQEYDILKAKSELTPNSIEDNNKLAEAEQRVADTAAEGSRALRGLYRQLKGDATSAGRTVDSLKEKAKSLYEELVKGSKPQLTQLKDEYDYNKALLEKYGYDTTLLTKKYNKDKLTIIFENNKKITSTEKSLYAALLAEQDKYIKNATDKERNNILGNRFIKDAEKINEAGGRVGFMDDVMPLNKEDLDKKLKEFGYSFEEWFDWLKNNALAISELGIEIDFPPEFDENNMEESIRQLNVWAETVRLAVKNAANKWRDEFADFQIENLPDSLPKDYIEKLGRDAKALLQSASTIMLEDDPFLGLVKEMDNTAEEYITKANAVMLESRRQMLTQYLEDADLTKEKRIQIEDELFKILQEQSKNRIALVELEAERTQQVWEAAFDGFDSFAGSIQTVTNAMSTLIQQEISEGKISEAQAKKKRKQLETLEKVSLAANIFQIAGSTASGIMGIWNAYALEKVANAQTAAATGPAAAATLAALNAKSLASAIINTAAMATAGAANIAAATMGTISKLQQFKEEGSAAVASTPNMAMIDSSVYSYSETQQNTPEQDELNRPIWVSIEDIRNGLRRVQVREEESSF